MVPSLSQQGTIVSSEGLARIDGYIQQSIAASTIPGLSLVIVSGQQVAYCTGYGLADVAHQTMMSGHTVLPIGSTGKSMTALAIMQLVEQGKLHLDAPVTRFLPFFEKADEQGSVITIRHLLSHSSGLPAGLPEDHANDADALERHVRSLASMPLHRVPGSGFEYSNHGYSTLGLLIQVVSGMAYEEYMARQVFAPLALRQSTFDANRVAQGELAQGYIKRQGVLVPQAPLAIRAANPAGMALSSAEDIGRYFLALLNGGHTDSKQIISAASLAEMWQPQIEVGNGMHYGLGWFTLDLDGLPLVAHNGDTLTSGSSFILIPSLKLGVGVSLNRNVDAKVEIARGVVSLLLGQEPPIPQAPAERAPNTFVPKRAIWGQYVGDYASQQGIISITQEGDQLLGSILNFRFELEALSDTEFLAHSDLPAIDEAPITFQAETDGRMTLLVKGKPFGIKREHTSV